MDAMDLANLGEGPIPNVTIELRRGGAVVADAALKQLLGGGSVVDEVAWTRLLQLVSLTYVPVSEHSRASGAGAGLLDND